MNPSLHAAARSRGSAFWDDNQPVQPALPTEFLGRPILFGDPQRWDLYYPDSNPAAGRRARRLMFNQLHGAWNLRGREIAMALLNPTHPTLREQGVHLRLQPLSVKTISATLYGLAQFANWHEQVHPDRNLGDLTDSDLDAFLVALAEQQATTNARICAIEAIRQLHQLHPVFTGGGITIEPWPGRTTASLTGRRPSPELSTPVIEPEVWWPLLRACWQYIDVFSHDILAARDEWNALDTTPPTNTRLRDATALVSQWASNPTNRVPIHRLTNGRFRAGEIHWTLLSLLISNGTSRSIFAATSNPHVRERRQLIENALQTNVLTTQPGGLTTRASSITRLDGTTGPWISGFDPATTTRQITVLRTACYIFTAALTMMRDSELLSITKDSITTYYGAPAVTANLYKKRRQPERKQWWVVEPVAQAINLAASLSETDYVFASIRGGHNIRFDRQEQLPLFLERLAELGPDAGLEPIPPAHLTPHMFRRTMAVITAQQPDGEIALGIQLKHASRRALANATTNGYAAETPAWAREFEHELQDSTATRLVDLWASQDASDDLELAGPGADHLHNGLAQAAASVQVGDERSLRNLLRDKFSTLRWGTLNHCLGVPDQALCLRDQPDEVATQGPMPNRCQPSKCRNSVITSQHAPIWLSEEADLKRKLADRRMAPHTRAQLQDELDEVQRITREFKP